MRRLRFSRGILLVMLTVLGARGLMGGEGTGEDFLRGDANGDGVVSVADVHRVLGFLFHGFAPPECMRSADVDESGVVEHLDAHNLWNFLRLGLQPLIR